MAKPKKRRKIIVFSIIGLVLAALTVVAVVRKREVVVTVQTEKVSRRDITEIVTYNGKIQPVLQVKISPEVSGEIIELPVREGQCVSKGDLILKIKPDFYLAARNQSQAGYESSVAGKATAEANLRKAAADFKRSEDLFQHKLMSESDFDAMRAAYDVAKAQLSSAEHQVEMSHAAVASAEDALSKTTIVSPLTGTISKLYSRVGERVVGTATMAGTDVMIIADLNAMEACVDVGEMDVVSIVAGQNARLEVDAFRDRKFTGIVTEIANSSLGSATAGLSASSSSGSQDATKFEVKIRVKEREAFRPGMSVTAEIETRSRTNVLTVPFASVTRRLPKEAARANATRLATLSDPPGTNTLAANTNFLEAAGTNVAKADKKSKESSKQVDVVFLLEGDHAKMVPVKIGIYDDNYSEIVEGLQEGQEVISGGSRAINRDLEDGKKTRKGAVAEGKAAIDPAKPRE